MWAAPYTDGYWGDSRVQANSLIQERWLAEISQDKWLHVSPTLFNQLGQNK